MSGNQQRPDIRCEGFIVAPTDVLDDHSPRPAPGQQTDLLRASHRGRTPPQALCFVFANAACACATGRYRGLVEGMTVRSAPAPGRGAGSAI